MNASPKFDLMKVAEAIVGSTLVIGLMDAVWLTIRFNYHNDLFYKIQKTELTPRLGAAAYIYLLIPVAVFLYAIKDAFSLQDAAIRGAVLGFILYSFYDVTNYATLINYTLEMALTDTAWGTVLCAAGAAAGFAFYSR